MTTKSKTTTASQVTQGEKAEIEDEKAEAKRQKKAQQLVGKLVHFYPAPAEGYNADRSAELEKERREADPVAAIITSVQPDGDEGQTIVNLQTFAPDGTSPSFGVDLVGKAGDGRDGTPFAILL